METISSTLFAGIDYGSKLAGTTVIARLNPNHMISFHQSQKKKDADAFLNQLITISGCSKLFIDAPLSLPLVYTRPDLGNDFFYREADRALSAMSPMFLGGLTARAMRMAQSWRQSGLEVYEIYPAQAARQLHWQTKGYKKDKSQLRLLFQELNDLLPFAFAQAPQNWHQLDAALAFYSGFRYLNQQHLEFGRKEEGMIIV